MSIAAWIARWKRADQTITEAIDAYVNQLADLSKALVEQMTGLPKGSDGRLMADASLQAVNGMISQAGWRGYVDPLRSMYADAATVQSEFLSDLGIPTEPSELAITRALSFTQGQLNLVQANLAAKLLPQLQLATTMPISQRTMVSLVREAVDDANPQARAKTAVNTATAGLQRDVATAAMDDLPDDQPRYYLYLGPDDASTRRFCRTLTGKAIPEDKLGRLKNGTPLPAARYGGGYNCRHSLIPITERIRKLRNIPIADQADLAQAERGGR